MKSLRVSVIAVAIVLTTVEVDAQVHLSTSRDGSKVIFNVPNQGKAAGRTPNYQWLARQRDRSSEYDAIIQRHAARYGVDPILVKAVITVESNFNPSIVSHKGACGLMQLMPATAASFGVQKAVIHDPEENIRGGVAYLARLQKLFPGDLRRTLAAYNAGEGAVLRHRGIPPYEETRTYVAKALTVYYGRPMGVGAPIRPGDFPNRGRLTGGFKAAGSAPGIIASSTASLAAPAGGGGPGTRR